MHFMYTCIKRWQAEAYSVRARLSRVSRFAAAAGAGAVAAA